MADQLKQTRREFINSAAASAFILTSGAETLTHPRESALHFSCNSYAWLTFYQRSNKEWMADPDASMREYASSGLKGYEPGINTAEEVVALIPVLKKYSIEMRSLYVGTTLHDAQTAQQNIDNAMKIASTAKSIGTKIIVTNPSPIRWGDPVDKDDAALNIQAQNLEKLGSLLAAQGMRLAYHNHDIELRQGAREFHHMLSSTDPRFVSFCLDVHWMYRGTGNSQVALFDVVRLYGNRISELHIRQSVDHVWSEVLGEGDIDYHKLVSELVKLKSTPNLVLEQCLEEKSPNSVDAVTAHKRDLEYAMKIFAPLAG